MSNYQDDPTSYHVPNAKVRKDDAREQPKTRGELSSRVRSMANLSAPNTETLLDDLLKSVGARVSGWETSLRSKIRRLIQGGQQYFALLARCYWEIDRTNGAIERNNRETLNRLSDIRSERDKELARPCQEYDQRKANLEGLSLKVARIRGRVEALSSQEKMSVKAAEYKMKIPAVGARSPIYQFVSALMSILVGLISGLCVGKMIGQVDLTNITPADSVFLIVGAILGVASLVTVKQRIESLVGHGRWNRIRGESPWTLWLLAIVVAVSWCALDALILQTSIFTISWFGSHFHTHNLALGSWVISLAVTIPVMLTSVANGLLFEWAAFAKPEIEKFRANEFENRVEKRLRIECESLAEGEALISQEQKHLQELRDRINKIGRFWDEQEDKELVKLRELLVELLPEHKEELDRAFYDIMEDENELREELTRAAEMLDDLHSLPTPKSEEAPEADVTSQEATKSIWKRIAAWIRQVFGVPESSKEAIASGKA